MRATRLAFVLAAALLPGLALADAAPATQSATMDDDGFDPDAWQERHQRAERELFDLLRSDASPRVQVLAGRIYLSDEDKDIPAALRPKGEDVVARAANLAPDDAYVQWVAASEGNYYSSQCGPTRWPEAEVANLVRLEPDNAAAWQYAVALAQVKGDQAGVDTALERMAGARRADDHQGEEIATWTRVLTAHPGLGSLVLPTQDDSASAAQQALAGALQRVAFQSSISDSALKTACKPDGATEQGWRRLDWCARAGRLLASEGNSFALRELGLDLLGSDAARADLQRNHDWLKANASNPMHNSSAFADAAGDRERDWHNAAGDITAAGRRMARLGKSATPPEGWAGEDNGAAAADASLAYMASVRDAMRASNDVREQALALLSERMLAARDGADAAGKAAPGAAASIAKLAAAHPDEVLVQWIAALLRDEEAPGAAAAAIANLQRVDPTNAATWALSLTPQAGEADTLPTLKRMAASRRHDGYTAGFLGIWSAAYARVPVPVELGDQMRAMDAGFDPAGLPNAMSMGSTYLTMSGSWQGLVAACTPEEAEPERRESCIAIGRLLLQQGSSLIGSRFGESLLRKFDALSDADRERARRIAWWQATATRMMQASAAFDAVVDDWLSTGSEIEALRLASTRAGKSEPSADWVSPGEKRTTKR